MSTEEEGSESPFKKIEFTDTALQQLKDWVQNQDPVFGVGADDKAFLLICYSLSREVGGPNDEFAQFIFNQSTHQPLEKTALRSEVGKIDGKYCIRIFDINAANVSVSIPQLQELVSLRKRDILIFPEIIAARITSQSLAPVIVRDWLLRSIFDKFAPEKMSYRDQLWVLRNNEVLLYAQLVSENKVIFQELHDLTAHIAGIDGCGFRYAGRVAANVHRKLNTYFGPTGRGNLSSHLIPFLIGVILDGLTQSMIYGSERRKIAIEFLLSALDELDIPPHAKLKLNGFPKGIDVINGLLQSQRNFSKERLREEIQRFLEECRSLTLNAQERTDSIPSS